MSVQAQRTRRELGSYNAGYRLGGKAWRDAEPDVQEGEPPDDLTDGMSGMKRDGFDAGWNDAMVEGG